LREVVLQAFFEQLAFPTGVLGIFYPDGGWEVACRHLRAQSKKSNMAQQGQSQEGKQANK